MTIAVPTDFSTYAKAAVHYAIAFARQVKAEVLLFHVLPDIGPTIGRLPSDNFIKEMVAATNQQFKELLQQITTEDVPVKYQVAFGSTVQDTLDLLVKTQLIDLVIMGTKGASGLKKILLGSNTVDVINHGTIPVIAVPEHCNPLPITHLVYASDFKQIEEEVKTILPYAKLLNATIRIVHIPPLQYLEQIDTNKLTQHLQGMLEYPSIEITLVKSEDVVTALESLTGTDSGQLLVLFTHEANFLDQLFSKSITREIVWHHKIPLLAIQNR